MRIIIAGSRTFNNYDILNQRCSKMVQYIYDNPLIFNWVFHKDIEFVLGGARGADSLGLRFAKENNFAYRVMDADWDTHGKSAGYIRNEQMADYVSEHGLGILMAFWDGISHGTANMIKIAKRFGIIVWVVRY